jgi:predicted  nucleic acid-binding Zn-ribbon protein
MKNILDKINKAHEVEATKLAKHEVELALLDDLKNQSKNILAEKNKLASIETEFYNQKKKLKSFVEIVQEQSKRLIELTNELKAKTNALGIETPKEVSIYLGQAKEFITQANDIKKRAGI